MSKDEYIKFISSIMKDGYVQIKVKRTFIAKLNTFYLKYVRKYL